MRVDPTGLMNVFFFGETAVFHHHQKFLFQPIWVDTNVIAQNKLQFISNITNYNNNEKNFKICLSDFDIGRKKISNSFALR